MTLPLLTAHFSWPLPFLQSQKVVTLPLFTPPSPLLISYTSLNLISPHQPQQTTVFWISVILNRPFSLRGHVTSFLWKWKLCDYLILPSLPSSKNPHFHNEAKCTTFLVKMSFICMRMKNHFPIKGWALNLVLIQRPGGTWKRLIVLNE